MTRTEIRYRKARLAVAEFLRRRDRRSYGEMIRRTAAFYREDGVDEELEAELQEAVLLAAESSDWRVASEAIYDTHFDVRGEFARRADIIARGLVSRYESLRQSSWAAVDSRPLARLVLDRLEARPTKEVMVWEVLTAVDSMLRYLTSKKDRARLVCFVARMEPLVDTLRPGRRSSFFAWKLDETLHGERFLNQPREEG